MYTFTHRHLGEITAFYFNGPAENAPQIPSADILGMDEISESRKAEIMKAVEEALAKNEEHDPKHEALKLAIQSSLDPVLNDPKKVFQMIEYAQEHGKSALTVLAISKRFATLIGDTGYFTELSNIEQNLIKDKNVILTKDHIGTNVIKESVRKRILGHLPDDVKTA